MQFLLLFSWSWQVDTQWRKVQDRMEESESGSRLEKIDRLEIFQANILKYIHYLILFKIYIILTLAI